MRTRRELLHGSAALALTYALPAGLIGSARAQAQDEIARPLDVPYVPTPVPVVDAMTSAAATAALSCARHRVSAAAASVSISIRSESKKRKPMRSAPA
jgi:hypothetical protein